MPTGSNEKLTSRGTNDGHLGTREGNSQTMQNAGSRWTYQNNNARQVASDHTRYIQMEHISRYYQMSRNPIKGKAVH